MGRFRCEERLAAEGPLETYRARVQGFGGFDRVYSVTCLAPGLLVRRPNAADAFLRAARSLSPIKDARIAPVAESGLAPGSAFVACEFVHGVSLQELAEHLGSSVSPRALPPAVWGAIIATIGADAAGALAAAHGALPALVHGALAPSNAMVTPQGHVRLLDFGLLAAVATPTEVAILPGRAPLVAPELRQASAPPAALEATADLFALGAMLERLAAIETPSPPPGIGVFPARPFPLSLRPLLRALTSVNPAERPPASEAEAGFRQILRELRGIDAALELGTLVRLIMQLRPAQAAAGAPTPPENVPGATPQFLLRGPDSAVQAASAEQSPFADEPTAVLDVSADGKPSSLAAILLEMRATDQEEVEAARPQVAGSGAVAEPMGLPDSSATRLSAVPLAMLQAGLTPAGGFSAEPPPSPDEAVMDQPLPLDLQDSKAFDVPITKHAGSIADEGDPDATLVSTEAPPLEQLMAPYDTAAAPAFLPVAAERRPLIEGAPTGELDDLTSSEISASLPNPAMYHPAGLPLPAPPLPAPGSPRGGSSAGSPRPAPPVSATTAPVPQAAAAAPEAIAFAEFSAAVPVETPVLKRETVTPPHWQPSGNLEGPQRIDSGRGAPATRPRRTREIWPIALAAAALLGAIGVALLAG